MRLLQSLALITTLGASSVAMASTIAIYSTGAAGGKNATAPTAGSPDLNYTLVSSPAADGQSATYVAGSHVAYVVTKNPAYTAPINAQFLSPTAAADGAGGDYLYSTTFNIGADPAKYLVTITGAEAADDSAYITLNNGTTQYGVAANDNGNQFTMAHPFTITSGFNLGLNTLYFHVNNFSNPALTSNPTGFEAQLSGVQATPEPSGLALLGTGVLGLAGVVRRRFVRS